MASHEPWWLSALGRRPRDGWSAIVAVACNRNSDPVECETMKGRRLDLMDFSSRGGRLVSRKMGFPSAATVMGSLPAAVVNAGDGFSIGGDNQQTDSQTTSDAWPTIDLVDLGDFDACLLEPWIPANRDEIRSDFGTMSCNIDQRPESWEDTGVAVAMRGSGRI
ncbi:hypothetical protein ACLOJK_005813 [Asimina triloba]